MHKHKQLTACQVCDKCTGSKYLPRNFFIELWHQGISLTNIDLWFIYNLFNSACTSEKQIHIFQGSHRLEKYLNLDGFLEKSLKIKSALKSTRK